MTKKEKKLVFNILKLIAFVGGVVLIVLSFVAAGKTYKGKITVSNEEHELAYAFSSHQVTQYIDGDKGLLNEVEWRNEDGMIQYETIIKWYDLGKFIGPVFVTKNPVDTDEQVNLVSGASVAELVAGIVLIAGACVLVLKKK